MMAGAADNMNLVREYTGRAMRADFSAIFQNSLNRGGSGGVSSDSGRGRYSVKSPGDAGVQVPDVRQENGLDAIG